MPSKRMRASTRNALGEALQWLVDLRKIKEKMEKGLATGGMRRKYEEEKPVAWQAAMQALAKAKGEGFRF